MFCFKKAEFNFKYSDSTLILCFTRKKKQLFRIDIGKTIMSDSLLPTIWNNSTISSSATRYKHCNEKGHAFNFATTVIVGRAGMKIVREMIEEWEMGSVNSSADSFS